MKIKFTPSTWQRILGFSVLDPDGWDRRANKFDMDWQEPLSFDQFMDKADQSTCSMYPSRETLRQTAMRRIVPNFPDVRSVVQTLI